MDNTAVYTVLLSLLNSESLIWCGRLGFLVFLEQGYASVHSKTV